MAGKLQSYFSRITDCLNHNTWMRSCKLFISFLPTKIVLTTLLIIHEGDIKINCFCEPKMHVSRFINTRYQIMMRCWQNDPNARPTLTKLRNQLKDMETQHKVRLVIIITTLIFIMGGSRLNHLPFVNQ